MPESSHPGARLIDRLANRDTLPWLLLGVTAVLVFFIGVGERQMHGTAAFYSTLSLTVAQTGVWLPLHSGPEPYFLKPPLVFSKRDADELADGLDEVLCTLPS